MLRLLTALAVSCAGFVSVVSIPARSAEVSVSNVMKFDMRAGEVQSTVVAPHLKRNCFGGRFLASDDKVLRDAKQIAIAKGAVLGRNLDGPPNAPPIEATFDSPTNLTDRYHGNDHDLVVLPNGDVLLVVLTGSKVQFSPKPVWWDYSYNYGLDSAGLATNVWGPGVRTTVLIYKSTDCGETFQFFSEFDPAQRDAAADRLCASPQSQRGPLWTYPGTSTQPVFLKGGSDGQLVKVDGKTGRIYLTHLCAGNNWYMAPTFTSPLGSFGDSQFLLGTPLNKTLVAVSPDSGANWTTLGYFAPRVWRSGIVALDNEVIFGLSNGLTFGHWSGNAFVFHQTQFTLPVTNYYDELANTHLFNQFVGANVWASPVISRVPGSKMIVVALPAFVHSGPNEPGGNGYRIYLYDLQSGTYNEIAPALPAVSEGATFLLHLVAIDIGDGPVLLYWSDFNLVSRTATVRGRLILSAMHYTEDFHIARNPVRGWLKGWTAHTWPLKYKWDIPIRWYGDYQTAWGFEVATRGPEKLRRFDFYPVWPEPNNIVRYARVSVVESSDSVRLPPKKLKKRPWRRGKPSGLHAANVQVRDVNPKTWVARPLIDVSRLPPSAPEFKQMQDYGRRVEERERREQQKQKQKQK